MDARFARSAETKPTALAADREAEAGVVQFKRLLSSDLEQSSYSKVVEGVPLYGRLALDAAKASGLWHNANEASKVWNPGAALEKRPESQAETERKMAQIQLRDGTCYRE